MKPVNNVAIATYRPVGSSKLWSVHARSAGAATIFVPSDQDFGF